AKDHHEQVYGAKKHESSLSHELIAGAAAFEAYKAYEKKREEEGHHDDHALAKEILAGLAAAEADKLFETKGLDFLDREKAKRDAKHAAEKLYSGNLSVKKKIIL
ncbi:putative phosphoglycerate mutase family protein, partial [Glomus cerebriforme]